MLQLVSEIGSVNTVDFKEKSEGFYYYKEKKATSGSNII